jgi:hypothetical protein
VNRWLRRPVPFWMWLATCIVLGLIFAVATVFITNSVIDSHDAKAAADRQQEGRALAIDVLCGAENGVAVAGRKVLAAQLPGQRGPGLPQSTQLAYAQEVTNSVLQQAQVHDPKLVLPDGQIDCKRLRVAARATHTSP